MFYKIAELAAEIYGKRFFFNKRLNQKLEERILFLCPLEEKKEKKAISFVGLQENKKLIIFTLKENSNSKENLSFHLDKDLFDLREYLQKMLPQDALGDMDVLSMVKETYWLGADKDFINIYLDFYTKKRGINPIKKTLVRIPVDAMPTGKRGNAGIETSKIELSQTEDINLNDGATPDDVEFLYIREKEYKYYLILKKTGRKTEDLLEKQNIINHKILSVYSTPSYLYLSSENEKIYEIDYSGRISKEFHPRIHAVARSITVSAPYLYAALTSREICRIDLTRQPDDPSAYSFYILFSTPVSIYLWGENLVVTTRDPGLIVFKLIPEAKDDEEFIYNQISKKIGDDGKDVEAYCQSILYHFKDDQWEESWIASLEYAAYTLSKKDKKHITESLTLLVHCINSYFPDKGDIIINFISRFLPLIKEQKKLFILLKKFYLTSRDQYRSELLRLLDVKNELEYFTRNDSGTIMEENLNRLSLFWCLTNKFYLKYIQPFTEPVPGKHVYSFIKILDLGQNYQHVAVELRNDQICVLDHKDFMKREPPRNVINIGEGVLFRDMDVLKDRRSPGKHYLYIADGKKALIAVEIIGEAFRNTHIYRMPMSDMCWTVKIQPANFNGYELIVIGFKNQGLGVYLYDYSRGDQFLAQQGDELVGEWVREVDVRKMDDQNYCVVAAGSRRKKVYQFDVRILDRAGKAGIELRKSGEKAFPDSLFCIRNCWDLNRKRFAGIAAGSDRGVLYFMDETLNLKWIYKLSDAILGIRLFQSEINKTEIAVCVQSGEVVFFSLEGMITRRIQFGKPIFAIDCGKLNLLKAKEHLICSVSNRLIIYEENKDEIVDTIKGLPGEHPEISYICRTLREEYRESGSPLLTLCDTIEKYYQCQDEESFLHELENNKANLKSFFKKHTEWAIPRLGRFVEEMRSDNWKKAEGIFEKLISQTGDEPIQQMDKESLQWLYLRYWQKVFKNFKQKGDYTDFYKWLKTWLGKGQHPEWLRMTTASMVADVLQIDTTNVLKQINDLLTYAMPAELFTDLEFLFNQRPSLDELFQRYAELVSSDRKCYQKKFPEFVRWFEESEKKRSADIKNFKELLHFYLVLREALEADTIQKINEAAARLLQPIDTLKRAGFYIQEKMEKMLKSLKTLQFKEVTASHYAKEKIMILGSLNNQLAEILGESQGPHMGDKLANAIAYEWQEAAAREINEYKYKIEIRISSGEVVETNISLDEGFLVIENFGGYEANDVVIRPVVDDAMGFSARDLKVPRIEPGPGHPVRIEIKKLLKNEGLFNSSGVPLTITIRVSCPAIERDGSQREYAKHLAVRLNVFSDKDFIKKRLHAQWIKKRHYSFLYPANYPLKFNEITKKIDHMLHQAGGLLFLAGEEGVGRSSLLISLEAHFQERGHECHYTELKLETARIFDWPEKCLSVFKQIAESIGLKDTARQYHHPRPYIEKLSNSLKNHILLLDLQSLLNMVEMAGLLPFLKELSEHMTVVVPVDRNTAQQLRVIYNKQSFINITTINEKDQQTFFRKYMGQDGMDLLPEHWPFLVGGNIYSTFLLAKTIKQQRRKPRFEECVQWMLTLYEKDKDQKKAQYYQAVWESLTLDEQVIVYICAKEYSEIPTTKLQEGMVVGKNLKVGKWEHKLYSKDDAGDVLRELKRDTILFKEDLDYIIRAQTREFKDTDKGHFPIKIHNTQTLLGRREKDSRLLLANYLKNQSRLENRLGHLKELGILKEYQISEKRYYAISDYLFMCFLLRRFDSYSKFFQNVALIRAFRAEDIKYAASSMNEKERTKFFDLLAIDSKKYNKIKEFANLWSKARDDGSIKELFNFLESLYWLKGSERYKIRQFNNLHEKFFEFSVPLTDLLRTVIVYIAHDDAGKILHTLNGRLDKAREEYKMLKGSELVFLVPLLGAKPYQSHPDWPKFNIALLDEDSILQYIQSSNPQMELLGQVSKYLNLRVLSPYKFELSVSGHMFVGRKEELGRVLNNPQTSFSVIGERKIGKTSFLRQIEYEYQQSGQVGVHPVFISWNDVYDEPGIWRQFSENKDMGKLFSAGEKHDIRSVADFQTTVKRFLNREKRDRIVFLIDEVDGLIENFQFLCPNCKEKVIMQLEKISDDPPCPKCDYRVSLHMIKEIKKQQPPEREVIRRVFDTFRSLALEYPGRCQFIFTGFVLLHTLHRDYRSAFLNFTERIDLGLLKYEEIRELVVKPMKKLGVEFKNEAAVLNTIFNRSCKLPRAIQYVCHNIIMKLSNSSNRVVDNQIALEAIPQMENEIEQHLHNLLRIKERWGLLYDLIDDYVQIFKEDFSIIDLMTFQEIGSKKPEPLFTEREMRDTLDVFAICFFLEKKEGNKFNLKCSAKSREKKEVFYHG